MKRILLLQSRIEAASLERERALFERLLKPMGVVVEALCLCEDRVDLLNPSVLLLRYDGVIFGGSSDFYLVDTVWKPGSMTVSSEAIFRLQTRVITRAELFIQTLVERDFPTLGICFGHQLLAHSQGVSVIHEVEQEEKGSFVATLTEEGLGDRLFSGLPREFLVSMVHRNVAETVPTGAVLLAQTSRCRVAGFRLGRHVYGVQFHPEFDEHELTARIGSTRDEMLTSVLSVTDERSITPIQPMPLAGRVLENFIHQIVL